MEFYCQLLEGLRCTLSGPRPTLILVAKNRCTATCQGKKGLAESEERSHHVTNIKSHKSPCTRYSKVIFVVVILLLNRVQWQHCASFVPCKQKPSQHLHRALNHLLPCVLPDALTKLTNNSATILHTSYGEKPRDGRMRRRWMLPCKRCLVLIQRIDLYRNPLCL